MLRPCKQSQRPGYLRSLGFQHLDLEVTVPRVGIFRDAIVDLFEMERALLRSMKQEVEEVCQRCLPKLRGLQPGDAMAGFQCQVPNELLRVDGFWLEVSILNIYFCWMGVSDIFRWLLGSRCTSTCFGSKGQPRLASSDLERAGVRFPMPFLGWFFQVCVVGFLPSPAFIFCLFAWLLAS